MKKWISWGGVLLVLVIAGWLALRLGIITQGFKPQKPPNARTILYWVAPMDPHYRRDKPGKSPMGMDLVPVYAKEAGHSSDTVSISPQVVSNLGIRTARVERRTLPRVIDTVGHVTANEDRIDHIHTYTSGWIRKLYVNKTGEQVKAGQILAELYSPTLINAQEEVVLALKNHNAALVRAGEKKLLTLGVSQQQINQLKRTRKAAQLIPLYASHRGIISELNIREGVFAKPEMNLMTIEDLSPIWIIAEVFERQANWVREKQTAIATFSYLPGKTWQGQVDYVYPQLDPKTHTLRVRLIFPNPDLTLKPQMYANIKILSTPVKNVLAIPREALIRTGHGDRVIIAVDPGQFRAQAVTVGIESGAWVAVLSGLKEGEHVVTSSQFLIDSESSLTASLTRLSPPHAMNSSMTQELIGMGVVKSVDRAKRQLVLDHKPIPAINMPAMTMGFHVVSSIDLSEIKPGDSVHFVLKQTGADHYQITKLHHMQMK